jgi:hypothetical protein
VTVEYEAAREAVVRSSLRLAAARMDLEAYPGSASASMSLDLYSDLLDSALSDYAEALAASNSPGGE